EKQKLRLHDQENDILTRCDHLSKHRDHDPGRHSPENLRDDDRIWSRSYGFLVGFDEIHADVAVSWTQNTGWHLDDAGVVGGVADRSNGRRTIARIHAEVLCSPEDTGQRLALLGHGLVAMAFHVERAIAMIASVDIPRGIATRKHDEVFALWRTTDP